DYHERIFNDVIENSEIPKVLNKYGYDYKSILEDEKKWTILEKSAPDLCADRVDYTLRDMLSCEVTNKKEIDEFLKDITVEDGNIAMKSLEKAEWFVDLYYKEVIGFFMNPLAIYSSHKLSNALRISLENNELKYDDLLKTDDEVLYILKSSNLKEVKELIESINYNVKVIENKDDYDIHIVNKLRTIDPLVIIDDKICRASEKSSFIKELSLSSIEKCKDGAYIKIIKN
ncbi:HD domain-containing protein, partial [Clostridium sp.]|uniref:HD domain-containing protein n=1 Tax=Clostridium sp. TaxID=1506 RepID=UPI003F31817F